MDGSGKRKRKSVDKNVYEATSLKKKRASKAIPQKNLNKEKQVTISLPSKPVILDENNEISIVTLNPRDCAKELKLSKDLFECYGCEGGYRMVRAINGVDSGQYYYEVEVLASSDNIHYRIGWSTRKADLQAPVGYDIHSYAYRDIDGSKVHDSLRHDNYGESYTIGDIIGCYIRLDDYNANNNQIIFYKNGCDQGVAYSGSEIPKGIYFPALSIYMKGHLRVNFGPTFLLKPPSLVGVIGVSEIQPMAKDQRFIHDQRILNIRKQRNSLFPSKIIQ